jgi:predicted alpha/beta-fold hydrolase
MEAYAKKKRVLQLLSATAFFSGGGFLLWRELREDTFKIRDVLFLVFRGIQSKRLRNVTVGSLLLTYLTNKFWSIQNRMVQTFLQILASAWGMYYLLYYGESPVVKCKKTLFNRQLIQKASLTERYWPTFWLTQADAMTALGSLFGDFEFLFFYDMDYQRTTLLSYDGINDVHLDWYIPQKKRASLETQGSADPVVVLVHGLGGSTEANYLRKFAQAAHANGWRACSYDWWRLDFAEWRDLDILIHHIAAENPDAPITLVGFSAGTHISLRYLQESGDESPLVAACIVSPCQDLIEEYGKIRDDPSRSHYKTFVDTTTKGMAKRSYATDKRDEKKDEYLRCIEEEVDCDNLYDRCIFNSVTYSCQNAPGVAVTQTTLNGKERPKFLGTEDHYAGAVKDKWDKIRVTTLLIHAMDDPILLYSSIDWNNIVKNKNLIAVSTERGGHVAWHEGLVPLGDTWCQRTCLRFMSAILEAHAQTNFILQVISKSADKSKMGDLRTTSSAKIARIVSSTDMHAMHTIVE